MSYSLGFTAGALLHKEAKEYIAAISSFDNYFSLKENVANIYIPTNSETSRKRIKGELDKRLRLLNSEYLNLFSNTEELCNVLDFNLICFHSKPAPIRNFCAKIVCI